MNNRNLVVILLATLAIAGISKHNEYQAEQSAMLAQNYTWQKTDAQPLANASAKKGKIVRQWNENQQEPAGLSDIWQTITGDWWKADTSKTLTGNYSANVHQAARPGPLPMPVAMLMLLSAIGGAGYFVYASAVRSRSKPSLSRKHR